MMRGRLGGVALCLALLSQGCWADRVRDLASWQGVRPNHLIGYGLIVGLDGTGDQTAQSPFTSQSTVALLNQLGVQTPPGTSLQTKNTASVMITGSLPPFAAVGQAVDLTVSSLGNAKSLKGGVLLMTPMKAIDGKVYAVAQGAVLVPGAGASGGGAKAQTNQLNVGKIPGGGIVEKSPGEDWLTSDELRLELKREDIRLVQSLVVAIGKAGLPIKAEALNPRLIKITMLDPSVPRRMEIVAQLEALELTPEPGRPRIVINPRTGSVVMTEVVRLRPCAIAHGSLTVTVQPSVATIVSPGVVQTTSDNAVTISQTGGALLHAVGPTLPEVVKALNALGASPQDLVSILQAMQAAGSLVGDLEVL